MNENENKEQEQESKDPVVRLTNELKKEVQREYSHLEDEQLKMKIKELVAKKRREVYISVDQQIRIEERVYSSIRGLDILDEILADDTITEVMINGPDNIFVEKKGQITKLDAKFSSAERLRDIINHIVGETNREVNDSEPIVDTRLTSGPAKGSRVNVVLPPISLIGPVVTIRKFSKSPMTIERLIAYGSITQDIADILEKLVRARYNIFVCGGTGSGKTTFLNALSNYIPSTERVITIEDSAELQITNVPNLISLETRNANTAGKGEVSMKSLIKSSLRMRPDRIVVGEVRGEEAMDMLQAMNTGHDGSLSTGHANSARDMFSRLETMVLRGSADGLPLPAVRAQISSALDIIIHLSRLRDHSRKVMEISEVTTIDPISGEIQLRPLFKFEEDKELSKVDKVVGSLNRTKNRMTKKGYQKLRAAGIEIESFEPLATDEDEEEI